MNRSRILPTFLSAILFSAALAFIGCETEPSVKVLASSWAEDGYGRANLPMGQEPEPQTYVFFRGIYFPGDRNDQGLAGTTFEEVCAVLRPYLAAQGYYLAPGPEEADITIVVNWGMSSVREEEFELAEEDLDEGTFAITATGQARENRLSNAKILGINDLSKMMTPFANEEKLRRLDTEQYFFILLGIDMGVVNALEGAPIKWVTRFSAPITDGPFSEVLPSLARVGARHAGRITDDTLNRTNLGIGEATMGELEEVPDEAGREAPPPASAGTP